MLIIPEKMYRVSRSSDGNPLSYLTHFDDTAAFKERRSTGCRWSGGYGSNKQEPVEVYFDNEPSTGFKIVKEAVRYSTSNVVWRVIDPRGFMVEIYSANFMSIISYCTVVEGEIQGNCIWGRENGKNFLIPEGSPDYKRSKPEGTKSINLKEVKIGSLVRLKDGTKATYLGKYYETKYYPLGRLSYRVDDKYEWQSSTTKRLAYMLDTGNYKSFFLTTVNNIIEVISDTGDVCIDDMLKEILLTEYSSHIRYNTGYRGRSVGLSSIWGIPTSTNTQEETEKYVLGLGFKRAEDKSLIPTEEV